jgi:hypothetical protein
MDGAQFYLLTCAKNSFTKFSCSDADSLGLGLEKREFQGHF